MLTPRRHSGHCLIAGWRRAALVAVSAVVAASVLAACSGHRPAPNRDALLPVAVPRSVTVGLRTVPGLGAILVDGGGHTLYMFPPDATSRVSCTGPCAGVWPPFVVEDGARPVAAAGVDVGRLGTRADPNSGARIVTYAGRPLYRYSGDVAPGQANGQALFNNGGPWYVLHADGQPVTLETGEDS